MEITELIIIGTISSCFVFLTYSLIVPKMRKFCSELVFIIHVVAIGEVVVV